MARRRQRQESAVRCSTADGQPVSGATITVIGGPKLIRAITDSNGFYKMENLETGGFYTVTPSRANYMFAPGNRSFSLVGDKTDAMFTGRQLVLTQIRWRVRSSLCGNSIWTFLDVSLIKAGLDYWSAQLRGCGADVECLQAQRISVSAAFFIEREFQDSGLFIYDLYEGALGRQPAFAEYSVGQIESRRWRKP